MTDFAPPLDTPRSPASAWLQAIGLFAIVAAALFLRTLGTDAPFTSADHVMIAYRSTCEPGWRWCFQNHYGPLQPLITKVYAHAVTGLGIPMTESLWRLPMGVVGSLIPLLAFTLARQVSRVALSSGLMPGSACTGVTPPLAFDTARRYGCLTVPPNMAAWFAALWTAALPPLVTDARYMWAYETLGTALALTVIIATFAYMDRPTRGRAWTVGLLLAAYFQSHLHIYAVPCVVALILLFDGPFKANDCSYSSAAADSQSSGTPSLSERSKQVPRTPGLWLPPLISLCVMIVAWRLVGGGPIGRIITKTSAIAGSPDRLAAAINLARAWLGHVGWLVAALVALILAISAARSLMARPATRCNLPRRAWFLMIWVILFAAPLFVLGFRTGRPTQYLTQATTVATILAVVVLFADRGARWRILVCVLISYALFWGSASANLASKTPAQWLGITAAWGAAEPYTAYKTAGWFVRKHIPPDAIVFTLHDTSGLERPVAEYYLGRACVAAEDLSPEQSMALFHGLANKIDVIVDDLRVDAGRPRNWPPEFQRVARIHNGGTDLIDILARGSTQNKALQLQPFFTDPQFDAEFGPRTLGVAPPKPPGFPESSKIKNLTRK